MAQLSPVMIFPVPFKEECELHVELTSSPTYSNTFTLPGYPRVSLRHATELREFLHQHLHATDLERMSWRLWMMSTQSSANISPLHQQKVKGREIVLTEDPRLHLVWIYDRIFIKPLPKYLLSHRFWADYLTTEKSILNGSTSQEAESFARIRTSALGFLRTYYYLVQHESDFEIATRNESRLLPSDISWTEFCNFSRYFLDITDDAVSGRYHYGELRLTRLNLLAKILLGKFQYERIYGQYGAFFARFYGPLLFIFSILSIILSAMQVELSAEPLLTDANWQVFGRASRWFAVSTLVCIAMIATVLAMMLVGMVVDECLFALKAQFSKRISSGRQHTKA